MQHVYSRVFRAIGLGAPRMSQRKPDDHSSRRSHRCNRSGSSFYLYADDLKSLREYLLSKDVAASEISFPFYMSKAEIRAIDPDGYALLIGQAD